MRVAAVQMRPEFGRVAENVARAEELIRMQAADLYVLPELFNTGYLFRDRAEVARLAEPYPDGPTCGALTRLSGDIGVTIVAGFAELGENERLYNSAFACESGRAIGCYRKIQLFDREREGFEPGDRPPALYPTQSARIASLICFDWIYPELTRVLALAGLQILAHSANLVLPFCQDAMVTRCIENRIFAITANRIGRESRHGVELAFTGRSQITSPAGERLARASADREEVLVAEIDPGQADDKQLTPRNHLLADRRPDLYAGLC